MIYVIMGKEAAANSQRNFLLQIFLFIVVVR